MACASSHQATTHARARTPRAPLQDFAKLPWEVDMPPDKAAAVLGGYLGVPHLEPASVLDLDVDQITGERV